MSKKPDGPPIPEKKMGRQWPPDVWPLVFTGSHLTGRDEWTTEAIPEAEAGLERNRKTLETLRLEAEREGDAARVEMLRQILETQERSRLLYRRTIFRMCDRWAESYLWARARNGPTRRSQIDRFEEWAESQGGVPKGRTVQRKNFVKNAMAKFGVSQRQVDRYIKSYRESQKTL